jgi:putative tryptophan/tyrosine transport system substrate-binding protein
VRRRCLVVALGASCAGAAMGAFGQRSGRWRVGFLSPRRRPASLDDDYYGAFPRTLRALGYVEGRNLQIEWRFAEGRYEALPAMAAELVKMNVDAIVAPGPPAALAARDATSTIPIIIVVSVDPVRAGLVASLARPGGNITGLSNLGSQLAAKHLELLRVVVPGIASVGVLLNGDNRAHDAVADNVAKAAAAARVGVVTVRAQTPMQIDTAFDTLAARGVDAAMIALDPLFIQQESQIATLALKHRLPSIFANREYAEAGGLMSYGQNQVEIYQRAAAYLDRIFKGARPGDLPIEEPTTLELHINGRTAKALGLAIPHALQMRVDRIIE